jgi:hypothetical protein
MNEERDIRYQIQGEVLERQSSDNMSINEKGPQNVFSRWVHEPNRTSEKELNALENDVVGKIMLASWCGTWFEVVQVLYEVHLPVSHPSFSRV